jgi:hypothetical protein
MTRAIKALTVFGALIVPTILAGTYLVEALQQAGSTLELQVTGRAGVPADASAVVLNITSAGARGTGFITAWPCGSPRPNASNLNYGVGAPVANTAIVKIGTGGKVCLFTADNDTELIADVNGWFPAGSDYVGITPQRLLDTRDDPMSGAAFVETFTGNTGLERFRTGVFHRDADAHGFGLGAPGENTWPADHDHNCGPPDTKRILDKTDRSGSFYMCRDHMMTSMGHVDGYSVVWFSPNQSFAHINRVCWDVNVSSNLLGHRQWWEVGILPVGQPDVFAIDWLAGTANLPNYGDVNAVVLGFGPDNGPYPKLSVGNNVVGDGSINDADRNDIAKRVPHCLRDNGNGTITYSNDTPSGGFTAPGSFPAGQLKVVFKDHSYTPDKDCGHLAGGVCASYTWHWDNIIVE